MIKRLRQIIRHIIPKPMRSRMLALWSIAIKAPGRPLLGAGLWMYLSEFAVKRAISLGPTVTAIRMQYGRPRSLWGVTPILTLSLKARADRELGFRSNSLVYVTYVISACFDINLQRPYLFASKLGLAREFQRFVLAWALLRYDVFHFFADRGLLDSATRLQINSEEIAALRAAGKRVYVYTYGADVRTREATLALGRWNFCVDCTEPRKYCACDDRGTERYLAELSGHVTAVVSLGDMLTYVPGARHIQYWPVDIEQIESVELSKAYSVRPTQLVIGHAPNHTHFKGSRYLEQTVESLKAEGYEIDYIKIQGVPNSEVLSLFAKCDVVADQFIGGAFGYTALEGMALGKPVLSFVRSADLVHAPDEFPVINTTPDNLRQVLLWLILNQGRLGQIGEQGRRYVQRWHCISAVAARLGQLYQETASFPPSILSRIEELQKREDARRNAIPVVTGWHHPFQVGKPLDREKLSLASSDS